MKKFMRQHEFPLFQIQAAARIDIDLAQLRADCCNRNIQPGNNISTVYDTERRGHCTQQWKTGQKPVPCLQIGRLHPVMLMSGGDSSGFHQGFLHGCLKGLGKNFCIIRFDVIPIPYHIRPAACHGTENASRNRGSL